MELGETLNEKDERMTTLIIGLATLDKEYKGNEIFLKMILALQKIGHEDSGNGRIQGSLQDDHMNISYYKAYVFETR